MRHHGGHEAQTRRVQGARRRLRDPRRRRSGDAAARLLSRAAAAAVVGDDRGDRGGVPGRERAVRGGLRRGGRRRTTRRPASFRDAFFFSVQTMGTIGYGAMFPESTAANVLVVAESIVEPAADGAGDRAGVREVLALDGALRVHAPRGDLADERRADVDVPPRQRARQPDRQRADPAGAGAHRAHQRGRDVLPDARPQADARARAVAIPFVERAARRSTRRARWPARRRRP